MLFGFGRSNRFACIEVNLTQDFWLFHLGSEFFNFNLVGFVLTSLTLNFALLGLVFGTSFCVMVGVERFHEKVVLLVGDAHIGRIMLGWHILFFEVFKQCFNTYIQFFCYFTYFCGHIK